MVFFGILLTSGFPNFLMQEAHAAVSSVSIQAPANSAYLGNDGTPTILTYRLTNDAGGGSEGVTSVVLTLTPTAGGSAITCTLTDADEGVGGIPANVNLGSASSSTDINLSASALQSSGCFNSQIVDGTTYNLDMSTTTPSLSATQVTSVRFDFTAPTGFTASASAGTNTITLTWNEAVDSAQTPANLANAFSLSGTSLTITEASDPADTTTMTLTLSGNIPEGANIQVSYDTDQANGDITDAADTNPNQAPDVNNVSVSLASTESNSGGSGCNGDCEEPTLGVLPSGHRVVEGGFTYNGHAVDVERFFTPYPLITAQVGKQNTAQFKIYENQGPDNIAHFSFAYGLAKGQIISESKAMIEVDFARDRTQTVTITDPENVLDNVKVTTDNVACSDGATQCLEVSISHMFREPLDFNIVGTNVWDYSRQSWQNYYNHGIEVVGESLNPPKQHGGIDKGHIYHLTETSKTTAIDEFGDSWTLQYGKWSKDFIKQERIQDGQKMVFDRMHSDFAEYRENIANDSISKLIELCPLCIEQYADFEDSTSWEYGDRKSKLTNSQMIMNLENQKAQEILKYIMDPKLSSTEKYKTLVELEKDDRPIAEILEEERSMKVILQAERAWLKQVIGLNQ